MNERTPYPFEVYNRPCSAIYDTDDGQFVLVDLQPTITIIQYPRSWGFQQCVRWAEENDFPAPELFGGSSEGCLMAGPHVHWIGNILGIPRDNH